MAEEWSDKLAPYLVGLGIVAIATMLFEPAWLAAGTRPPGRRLAKRSPATARAVSDPRPGTALRDGVGPSVAFRVNTITR